MEFVLHPFLSIPEHLISLLKRQKRMLVGAVTDFHNWNGSVDETVCRLSTAFSPILATSSLLLLMCVNVCLDVSMRGVFVRACVCARGDYASVFAPCRPTHIYF